ncbi:hypothetical protein TorRG33x02_203160 [Trema orientale]|uniref:Endonuclease/exonuclease/phosphatase n=1 Tax=Trema orientale TaxID=63057 RepID=A0A2P5EED3_TREOI|nr:hypothetical protein TorRG33x02_203160 [Trema orientale]
MGQIIIELDFFGSCIVEGTSTAGRICLFWCKGTQLDIIHSSKTLIVAMIVDISIGYKWLLCCGHCLSSKAGKSSFWVATREVVQEFDGDSVIIGDFNKVIE